MAPMVPLSHPYAAPPMPTYEYTTYFLQQSEAKGPSGNKQFQTLSGNISVYSFTKTIYLYNMFFSHFIELIIFFNIPQSDCDVEAR